MAPSPPTPLPRWGRGEDFVFFGLENHISTRRPWKGRGDGVRGIVLPAQNLQHSLADCLSHAKPRSREGKRSGLKWSVF